MQSAFISKLLELAERDGNVLYLLADNGTNYDGMFRHSFPEQIVDFGICEEHMVAAAAGMASAGKIPFVFTAGAFLCYRSLEFIRNDVCFQNQNVKLVGMGSGLSISSLGPTHHTTEDVAVLRALPNLLLLSPATPYQAAAAVELAYRHEGPVYIRLGMSREKEFFEEDYRMEVGKSDLVCDGEDAVVFTTGSILEEAAAAAERLRESGVSVRLVNVTTLKPFGTEDALRRLAGMKRAVTVEEHNVSGGLGAIVAETIARAGLGIPLTTVGVEDRFAEGYGTVQAVRRKNGLDAESLCRRLREVCGHE